jgi:hypothetical protein
MSYGRSSQVISLLGTGILINIGRLRGSPRAAGPRERRSERRNDGTAVGKRVPERRGRSEESRSSGIARRGKAVR